jgi:pimeloyl-ACP methyl ester carboxylesterase
MLTKLGQEQRAQRFGSTRHNLCTVGAAIEDHWSWTMSYYDHGPTRIRYEEAGGGFPLLVMPGGGLNSRVGNWATAVYNFFEAFQNEYRVITMDQRNANEGESAGPLDSADPWGAFADDQLGLLDHLGVREFIVLGCCIGGPFVLKLMERAPDRVVAGVLCQPVGHRPEDPDVMYRSGKDVWAPALLERRPDITTAEVEAYLHALYRRNPDFVYSVSREFVSNCSIPMLVMPDDVPAHPYQVCADILALAPNAEATIYPWKQTPELKSRAVAQVRTFLEVHRPVAAGA